MFAEYALLTVQPVSSDVDRLEEISLKTHCVPRLWVYIVPPILLAVVLIGVNILYYWKSTTRIKLVSDAESIAIKAKFKCAWDLNKGDAPQVEAVFVIKHRRYRKLKWHMYRWSRCLHQKSEVYYHGTRLCCNITKSKALCNIKECGICRISGSGFDCQNIIFQRLGPSFYLAPNTSKCHDYTLGAYGCRALLLCDVYSGKKYIVEETNSDRRGPPKGYHSIYCRAGISLNYDEIGLPYPDAILPRYIIVYQKDGVERLIKWL